MPRGRSRNARSSSAPTARCAASCCARRSGAISRRSRASPGTRAGKPSDPPPSELLPAFVVGELRSAFAIGLALYLPFIAIDLAVASILMGLGMFMLSPPIVSLPCKLLALRDGRRLGARLRRGRRELSLGAAGRRHRRGRTLGDAHQRTARRQAAVVLVRVFSAQGRCGRREPLRDGRVAAASIGRRTFRSPTARAARRATRTIELAKRIKRETRPRGSRARDVRREHRGRTARDVPRAARRRDRERPRAARRSPERQHGVRGGAKAASRYATDLIALLAREFSFCIGGAAYPEKHPEAATFESDLAVARRKQDAGAEFLITQLFFDNAAYAAFVARARAAGITIPIVPGIMPITNYQQIERFVAMCGADDPGAAARRTRGAAQRAGSRRRARRRLRRAAVRRAARARRAGHPLLHAEQVAVDARRRLRLARRAAVVPKDAVTLRG